MTALVLVLFSIGFVFFFVTTLIILHNKKHFRGLISYRSEAVSTSGFDSTENILEGQSLAQLNSNTVSEDYKLPAPKVSILIPARNEERNLYRLLDSIESQTYSRLEVIILDDHSEDRTRLIADEFALASRFQITVHSGLHKPAGWGGKNWACHQLADHASGDVLLFLDADTWLASTTVSDIVINLQRYKLDFATVWPHQVMATAAEKAIVSNVYATIATYLPTLYSYKSPAWIPGRTLKNKTKPLFAAACGQCMIFTREAYKISGGHSSIKDQVVEDVLLAQKVVQSGKSMRMFHGTDRLWCRMYDSHEEIFNGFRKNFFAGFGYRLFPFLMAWILHAIVYLVPPVVFLFAAAGAFPDQFQLTILILSAVLTFIPMLQRFWVSKFFKWPAETTLLYLPGILWFQMLAVIVVLDRLLKTRATWKGRPV